MKKKVFVSQPMAGKPKELIREERASVVKELEDLGYEVIDSIVADTPEEASNKPVFYLSQSILKLSQADYAYFMIGWSGARGCQIEYEIATRYNIPILNE
jgi:hypothetical protein